MLALQTGDDEQQKLQSSHCDPLWQVNNNSIKLFFFRSQAFCAHSLPFVKDFTKGTLLPTPFTHTGLKLCNNLMSYDCHFEAGVNLV